MNENGVSTCKTGEKYEKFQMTVGRKRRTFYHYDYRDTADNELFSCVKPTLEEPEGIEDYSYTKDGKEIRGSQYKVRLEFPKRKK